jgi:quercetin dioxygenase-like cupin family protein
MPHRLFAALLLVAIVFAAPGPTTAADNQPTVTPLLSTGTTILGEPLHYPQTGAAHVNAAIVTLPPGARTSVHKHGVPMFGYVLDGEVTVDYGDRGKRIYRQGEALMEAMDVAHFGTATATQPTRILVVYMSAEGAPADVIPVR